MSKILIKEFSLDIPESLYVEYVENFMIQQGYKPVRWAIVEIKNNKLIIDSVVKEIERKKC